MTLCRRRCPRMPLLPAPLLAGLALGALGLLVPTVGLATLVVAQAAPPPAPAPDLKAISGMIEKGQLVPAEQQLRRILAQGGGPAARDLLGVVLTRQGRAEEAEKQFQQALAAGGESGRAGGTDLGPMLSARQHLARLYLSQKRETEALAELRRAARQGPLERDLALKLASAEIAGGDAAAAERQLRSVAERFQSAQALLQLARLRSTLKDTAGSAAALRQALALAPNSEDVLSAYAQVSLASRAPVPAIRSLEPLTRMHPSLPQYHYLLGVAMMQVGDLSAAVEALQRAEQLEPNHVLTLVALGLALNNRKLYAEAKPYLARSLELEPDNVEAVAALAEAEEGTGELAEAEALARRVLVKVDGHATANLVIGLLLMKQERYAEARAALERAAATDPSSTRAHYQLSLACARLGDEAGSRSHLELYQRALREIEERVKQMRNETGLASGGMHP